MYDDGGDKKKTTERIKVVDTEDCSRGPLSKCIRLADSSRVIQRLKEMEMAKVKPPKKKEEPPPIHKFVPLKPNPALLNAPVRGEPGATGGPNANEPVKKTSVTIAPIIPSPMIAAPALVPTTVTPATPAPRYGSTTAAPNPRQLSTESSSSATSSENPANKASAEAEEEDDEYEYYEYETDEEEDEAEVPPIPPARTTTVAPAATERKTSYTSPYSTNTTTAATKPATPSHTTVATAPAPTTTTTTGVRAYGGARTMPNIANIASPAAPVVADAETADLTSSITAKYFYN
jgi:hypothetical protein